MKMTLTDLLGGLILKLLALNGLRKRELTAQLEYIGELAGKFAPRFRDNAPYNELYGYSSEAERAARQFASATADVLGDEELDGFQALVAQVVDLKSLLKRSARDGKDVVLAEMAEVAAAFRASAETLKGRRGGMRAEG